MKKMLKVFYLDFVDKEQSGSRRKRSISTEIGTLDINVDLNVPIDDIFANTHLACFLMHEGVWNASFCTVNKVTTDGKYAQVHCNCQNSGFIAVGLLNNTNNETVYIEEVYAFKEQIKFKIEENYTALVDGVGYQEFRSSIRTQLMDILDCQPLNIRELRILQGSIIVEFLLVGADKMEAEQLKQSHAEMVALLASGTLKLEMDNGTDIKELYVPQQCVYDCDNPGGILLRDDEDFALLIIGSCLMGIVCLVLICIIVGVCMKKKKQDEKLQKLTAPMRNNELTPNYRAMAFTENMEGTTDSLVKYKRNPTYVTSSPMMPLPAAYEVNTFRDIKKYFL